MSANWSLPAVVGRYGADGAAAPVVMRTLWSGTLSVPRSRDGSTYGTINLSRAPTLSALFIICSSGDGMIVALTPPVGNAWRPVWTVIVYQVGTYFIKFRRRTATSLDFYGEGVSGHGVYRVTEVSL